jgi:hypothetical protein
MQSTLQSDLCPLGNLMALQNTVPQLLNQGDTHFSLDPQIGILQFLDQLARAPLEYNVTVDH